MQQLTINVYQHGLPLRMLNTWIKTKFHLTPLPQGSSLTIKWKEMIFQQGCNALTASIVPQCPMPVLHPEVFCHFFSTQKVVKLQKTYWGSKLNFHLVGKMRISIKLFLNFYPLVWVHAAYNYKWCIFRSDPSSANVTKNQFYHFKDLQIAWHLE